MAAELAGVHPQTLRIYERKGLLDPARTGGGSRRYSEHDITLLRRIQELTNAGLNLEGVRRVMELEAEVEPGSTAELEQVRAEARDGRGAHPPAVPPGSGPGEATPRPDGSRIRGRGGPGPEVDSDILKILRRQASRRKGRPRWP